MSFMIQVHQWETQRVGDAAELPPGAAECVYGPGTPCSGLMHIGGPTQTNNLRGILGSALFLHLHTRLGFSYHLLCHLLSEFTQHHLLPGPLQQHLCCPQPLLLPL